MTVLDERLPRWVATVELDTSIERLGAVRAAAAAIGAGLAPGAALDLVAYAMGRQSAPAFARVRDAIARHDETFNAAASDLEPRLIAAAALALSLEDGTDASAIVASGVLCAEFAGLDSPVEELPDLARAALAGRFRALRTRMALPRLDLSGIFEALPAHVTTVDDTTRAMRMLADRCAAAIDALRLRCEERLDIADEELDVLWWAFSKAGDERGMDSLDVNASEMLLRTASELAERHRFNAEIPSTVEILSRVLGPLGEEEYSVAEVATDAAERVELPASTPGPLLPILTSCAEFLAFRDAEHVVFESDQSWMNSAGRYGVDPTIRRRGAEIAAQTLRELLLVRACDP